MNARTRILPSRPPQRQPPLRSRFAWVAATALIVVPAHAAPILHERIPDDVESDFALGAVVAGDIPAIIETPRGYLGAPDPRRLPSSKENAYAAGQGASSVPGMQADASYVPDRDTRRPETLPYDDPFTPSTAPFKRLVAFDSVRADFSLSVQRPDLRAIPRSTQIDASDDRFFADLVIDAQPGTPVRIPTVGPGTRVIHAHLAAGNKDVAFNLLRDDAENWFMDVRQPTRARLVMELAVRRSAFGGELGNASWSELPRVAPLPPNVAASARIVAEKIGVSRDVPPHEVIRKLVAYFRAFRDSEEPPKPQRDVYLDLALSQKGVCRHRAFAFLITSLGIGVPARMVLNEAHAWVEVNDGRIWRRIDLGGAGRMLANPLADRVPHDPPTDPFTWPAGATRGEDIAGLPSQGAHPLAQGTRNNTPRTSPSSSAGAAGAAGTRPRASASVGAFTASSSGPPGSPAVTSSDARDSKDARPPSTIDLAMENTTARRGEAVRLRGTVKSAQEPCGFVTVTVVFRTANGQHELRVGALATDAKGDFSGNIVIPPALSVGDYDLVARTEGDLRCGASR